MSFLVGPVNSLGHPFPNLHEVPIERRVGEHLVYAFGQKWLYADLEIVPAEPVEAVLLWDPGWLRDGTMPRRALDEVARVRAVADGWDCPVFGLSSDWFATWGAGGSGMYGTMRSFQALDGLVVDPVGAAALRMAMPGWMRRNGDGKPIGADPNDYRYRAIVELTPFLSYGRLPNVGGEDWREVPPPQDRSLDVTIVSNLYPGLVVARSYFVEAARRICQRRGWSFIHRSQVSPEEMECLYLDSRAVLNVSLGTQPN